jgi:hypothetical protein
MPAYMSDGTGLPENPTHSALKSLIKDGLAIVEIGYSCFSTTIERLWERSFAIES